MSQHSVTSGRSQPGRGPARAGGRENATGAGLVGSSGVRGEGRPASNTRASNFAGGVRCLYRGLDWVSKTVQVSRDELVGLLDWLEPLVGSEVSRGGRSFLVGTAGGPHGFVLRLGGGLQIALPGRDSTSDRVVITGTSEWCAGRDNRAADAELGAVLLDVLGLDQAGRVVGLSRADVTADFLMPEEQAAEFFELVRSDAVVSRGRDLGAFRRGKRWTGSKIGKRSVVLRLYDKLTELKQKGALQEWLSLWGLDAVPDGFAVVRVEWQLRGDWLRERAVRSVAGLLGSLGTLLEYLNGSWFRLAGPPAGHVHKRETLPLWAAIASLMAAGTFAGMVGGEKVVRAVSVDLGASERQSVGVLAWLAACLADGAADGVVPELADVAEYLRRRVDPDWWSERVGRRMVAARYGVAA